MKKISFLILLIAATCCVGVAQNVPPAVSSHANCAVVPPQYGEWYQQTRLSTGEAYVADEKRKQQILDSYRKLKLQMTLDEVEGFFGKPDFGTSRPPLHLAGTAEPADLRCSNDLAYIVRKTSENMLDTEDVAVYLSFPQDGKLFWAAPQNLPTLKQLGAPAKGK